MGTCAESRLERQNVYNPLTTPTPIQAYLGDSVGSVPDHLNKVNIAINES